MKNTFTTKETYLQWTSEWKAQYSKLTNDIHEAKYARWYSNWLRQPHTSKLLSEAQSARYAAFAKKHANQWGGFLAEATLAQLRAEATAMLELRKQAKVEAQRQYLAAHAPVCA